MNLTKRRQVAPHPHDYLKTSLEGSMAAHDGPVISRRTILRTALGGCGAALLAACGGSGTPTAQPASGAAASTAPQASGGAPTKLVFWRHQYEPTDKALREIIFPSAKAQLNIEFDFQVQRDADYKTTMLPQLASGGGPDIFEATDAFRIKFSKAGVYAPLDYGPWGGKAGWERYWQQGVVEALRVDGKDFTVPIEWTAIPVNLFVNSTHAQQVGLDGDIAKYQQTPITWADLGPWAAKMTTKDASGNITRDGFLIQHGYGADRTYAFWEPYFLQAGGKLLSEDGKTSTLDTAPGIAAMQNLSDYVFKHGASMLRPQDKESGSAKMPKEETSSTTAMSQWAYGTFKQLAPDKWQTIRSLLAPQIDPAKPLYDSGPGWSYGVLAKSKNQAVAFKFLQFMVEKHGSDLFDGGIVAPIQGWTDKYAGFAKLPDAAVWKKLSEAATPRVRPEVELLTQVQRAEGFQRAFEAIMFNKADIKTEMTRWNKDVQEAVKGL